MNSSHACSSSANEPYSRTQVGVLRDQVGLAKFHRRLHPALAGRVGRLAGQHRHPVMPAKRDDLPVPHRHPGHMLHGDGLLVVGQHKRRCPIDQPKGAVQGGDHRRLGAVPQRDHHPEPGPGQPGHEQHRLDPVHDGAVAEVVLQPHPRLGDPRPMHPGMSQPVRRLHPGDRPPGRPVRPAIAERQQLLVGLVGANPALRRLHPLLDLVQERIRDLRPAGQVPDRPARIPCGDMRRDRVMRTPHQHRRRPGRPGQVVRSKNFHDLSVRLHMAPPRADIRLDTEHRTRGVAPNPSRRGQNQ